MPVSTLLSLNDKTEYRDMLSIPTPDINFRILPNFTLYVQIVRSITREHNSVHK